MAVVLRQCRIKALLSDEHFSVDGTLIEVWPGPQRHAPLQRREAIERDA